jgi:DNA-binding NarL/FixJ family response regulator
MTFLIADDNAHVRESLKRFLIRNIPDHHSFLEAADGAAAVTMYNRFTPDWVLMDIEMAPLDGLTALKEIREAHPGAKVIVVTCHDEVALRDEAKKYGACGYVMKDELDQIETIMTPTGSAGSP